MREVWLDLHIGTVIKQTVNHRLKEVVRHMSHGSLEQAEKLIEQSCGGTMLNTSFIERFNATMRERLAVLTRKCRHGSCKLHALETGMYLIGSTYNFCWTHQALSRSVEDGRACRACKPAMASGLTDHVWSVFELLSYTVAPPPFCVTKRRGRPRTRTIVEPKKPQQSRVRLQKGVLCPTTSYCGFTANVGHIELFT